NATALGGQNLVVTAGSASVGSIGTLLAPGDVEICVDGDLPVTTIVATGTVTLRSLTGAIVDINGGGVNVAATGLAMSAITGIGVGDAIETVVSRVEAETSIGGIFLANTGDLIVGGVTPGCGLTNLSGVQVTGATGSVDLTNTGNVAVTTTG